MAGVETGSNRVGQNTVGGGLEAKDDYREGNRNKVWKERIEGERHTENKTVVQKAGDLYPGEY